MKKNKVLVTAYTIAAIKRAWQKQLGHLPSKYKGLRLIAAWAMVLFCGMGLHLSAKNVKVTGSILCRRFLFLFLLLSLFLSSCSLFRTQANEGGDQHIFAIATVVFYCPGEDEGSLISALDNTLICNISYPEFNGLALFRPKLVTVKFRIHDRRELDSIINRVVNKGFIVKSFNF